MKVKVRMATVEDIPFIKSTWLYSYYNGNPEMQRVDKPVFMSNYSKVIDSILVKSTTFVACLDEDEDVLVGFSCVDRDVLHFVYVKKMWRGLKIHLDLLPDIKTYTHITRQFLKIKPRDLKFNPFLIGR